MVTEEGQLYTIEGVAAAVLLVFTAYLILSSTSILTPGDTHINDMQLEQLGNDVLRMMDTAEEYNEAGADLFQKKKSFLEEKLTTNLNDDTLRGEFTELFIEKFREYAGDNRLKVSANISYRDGTDVKPQPIWNATIAPPVTNRDHYVTVTRWVHLNNPDWDPGNNKTVLLEVLLWRD
ncbi:MAG: hypothetical protein WC382_12405 [Methanoregulaceae archaeon]|jgi:hypothetical protein